TLNASSVVNEGGRIFLKASQDAYVDGNGRIVTTGTTGGKVEVLGDRVAVMDNASIDASGTGGGGRIMVGGDYQGKNADVQNADITYFGPNASLKADATEVGAGGTVIVWADDTTRAHGMISARGGANGGDGGFVETSGKGHLSIAGARVDTRAPMGKTGNWLLDPTDITIVSGGYTQFLGDPFDPLANSTITDGDINSALSGSSLTIQTSYGGGGTGGITMLGANVSHGGANSLSLLAYGVGGAGYGGIWIQDSSIVLSGGGNLTMVAGWDGTAAPTSANVVANRGDMQISGSNLQASNILLAGGGDIKLVATTAPARVTSNGPMVVAAGGQLVLFGSNTGGFDATLHASSGGSQTIQAGSIDLTAGFGGNWAYAMIRADGEQQITTTNGGISLSGGSGAHYGGFAQIDHFLGTGNQTINIAYGGIALIGGSATGTTTTNPNLLPAVCQADPLCVIQPVTGAWAGINNRVGSQTVDFQTPYSMLTIVGGSGGVRNSAWISQSGAGVQTISGAPIVTMSGGASGGSNFVSTDGFHHLRNNASIFAPGAAQMFAFDSLTLWSSGVDPNRVGTSWIVGNGQTIAVAGSVVLLAGDTNAGGGSVGIQSSAGQTITAGAVTLTGGGLGYDNTASIRQLGAGSSQSLTAASLAIQGGSGNGTGGSTSDCGAPCVGYAASNNAGVFNLGSGGQTVDVTGLISVVGGTVGNRNNAYI
ncbi:MAG TPA: hypothetical protein PK819_12300, partial [Thermomicrobiales bacterium]|nr:hypothetical protein [Thermomicrobiales bacterium]